MWKANTGINVKLQYWYSCVIIKFPQDKIPYVISLTKLEIISNRIVFSSMYQLFYQVSLSFWVNYFIEKTVLYFDSNKAEVPIGVSHSY